MNPIAVLLIGAGYGYLAGNPTARKNFFNSVANLGGRGIDALNNMGGGDANVPTPPNDAVPRTE